jgi:hypothetical protein
MIALIGVKSFVAKKSVFMGQILHHLKKEYGCRQPE